MQRNQYKGLIIIFLLFFAQCQLQSNLSISLQYTQIENSSSIPDSIAIYSHNQLNSTFAIDQNYFDCGNYNLFTLNLTANNSNYTWVFTNFNTDLLVSVFAGYNHPTITNVTCNSPGCQIVLDSHCPLTTYNTSFLRGVVYSLAGQQIIQFKYYTQCNIQNIQNYIQIQWGLVIIAIINIITIWVCSKYQEAHSFNNYTLSVNYIVVSIYLALSLTKFFLFYYQVPYVITFINYLCNISSFFFGIISVMICFCQLAYYSQFEIFQRGYKFEKFRIRVMDVAGILFGVGLLCAWYFTRDVILSDLIFMMIYLSIMKIVKFGSLKLAVILFGINFVILVSFSGTNSTIDSSYTDGDYTYFNNPLFLIIPNLVDIPNRRCAWYFIVTMSYAGLLLSYLERFDRNRSSIIYGLTFIITYIIGTVAWFIITIFVAFPIPYELFSIPIALLLLAFFSNRRGELTMIFHGTFYDEQRMSMSLLESMKQNLQTPNQSTVNKSIFEQLKNELKDSASNQNTVQIQNGIQTKKSGQSNTQRQKQLKYMNSQGIQSSNESESVQGQGNERKYWKSQIVMNIKYQ